MLLLNLHKKFFLLFCSTFFVLWHCWLGDRKGIRPVKLSVAILAVVIGTLLVLRVLAVIFCCRKI